MLLPHGYDGQARCASVLFFDCAGYLLCQHAFTCAAHAIAVRLMRKALGWSPAVSNVELHAPINRVPTVSELDLFLF